MQSLFDKCEDLIRREIRKLDGDCNSFKTTSGAELLAMLASFKRGRNVLKSLLSNQQVNFCFLDFKVTDMYGKKTVNLAEKERYFSSSILPEFEEVGCQPVDTMSESVLTVLIREREYQLYHLFVNRILSDSEKVGPEGLSTLTEALILLQKLGNKG